MWVPPEIRDPIPLHAPMRKSMACFGAVTLLTRKFEHVLVPTFNSASFEPFLRKLLRHRSRERRLVVVLDNALITTLPPCERCCASTGTS